MDVVKAKKRRKIDITEFMDSINNAKAIMDNDVDVITLIKYFAEQNKVDQKIVDEAIRRIILAQDNTQGVEDDE